MPCRRRFAVCVAVRVASRLAVAAVAAVTVGCGPTAPVAPPKPMYSDLGPKEVPEFLRNTVYQQTDLANASPMRVSGFGLVVNLDGTGDTRAPTPVRDYIQKQLQTHGFGSSQAGLAAIGPDQVLNDRAKRTAIVRVDGYIPPGAHDGQTFDVQVSALDNSNTTSLNHGELYQTDLATRGADPFNPGGGVINPQARASGPIAINPAYALADETVTTNQKLSMRFGVVMGRGVIADERPLVLKLRQPQRRLSRQIESRINERFQDAANERFNGSKTAVAKDEAEIWIYVPKSYQGDWERFANVATHLYSDPNADFAALQAKRLGDIATADGDKAALLDISYCWEALGEPALPAVQPLYASPVPAVAYAAARAGAFLGDHGAQAVLTKMAETAGHPFQINAVQILGQLTPTAQLRTTLYALLDSPQLLVRVEAYKAMVATNDPKIVSTPMHGRFTLDLVESAGPPVIYATRVGEPRIALIGRQAKLVAPSLLMAMNDKLTVLADVTRQSGQIYFRGDKYEPDASLECKPDLPVIVARLGGESPAGEPKLRFHYTDVVGLLQKMVDKGMIASDDASGSTPAVFQLQSIPGLDDPILSAPSIPEQRPQDVGPTTSTASAVGVTP